jgi:LemA protein
MPFLIAGGSLFIIALIIVFYVLSTKNMFKRLETKIAQSQIELDHAIGKWFLLYQDFYKHLNREHSLTEIRLDGSLDTMNMIEKAVFMHDVSEEIEKAYLALSTSESIKNNDEVALLFDVMHELKNELDLKKCSYHALVSEFNQKVVVFPSHMVATWLSYEKKPYLEIDDSITQTTNLK